MIRTPIEELMRQCPSVYKLVVVAGKRAKELTEGSPKLIETTIKKVTTIALEEIREGKVAYREIDNESDEASSGSKKKRSKESKSEKKKS